MIPVALILLAAATHVDLVDDVFHIPSRQWRYVELALRQRPALVSADLDVRSGSRQVRLALLRPDDLQRLREDRPFGVLATTDPAGSDQLRYQVRVPGDYVLLIDNRTSGDQGSEAHIRVSLDFGSTPGPAVTQLPFQRQILVIAISFAVFFAIAGFSARRLLRGIRH
ncbi:MAG TPA: hypothetical protein VGF16_15625 [Bryobacteraceae bacterium]|jgi:hypothetical protein